MTAGEDPNQKIVVNPNQARQGANVKGMPSVLIISTVGAFVLMGLVYLLFFR